jgi:hypothetical protein
MDGWMNSPNGSPPGWMDGCMDFLQMGSHSKNSRRKENKIKEKKKKKLEKENSTLQNTCSRKEKNPNP